MLLNYNLTILATLTLLTYLLLMCKLEKYKISVIISGGQTGADRGALDFAIYRKIMYGGWCPLGRKAEDKVIPPKYLFLKETTTSLYPARTRMNIRDSDATLIFTSDTNSKGSLLTTKFCIEMKKPYYIVIINQKKLDSLKGLILKNICQKILKWLEKIKPEIINIAGTRESHCHGIQRKVAYILSFIFENSQKKIEWPPKKPTTPDLCFNN